MNNLLNKFLMLILVFGSALSSTVQLDSAEVPPTCQVSEISNPLISDLCSSIANEVRNLEYLHCFPSDPVDTKLAVPHFIFQKIYSDKENWEGEELGGLFSGFGAAEATTRNLKNITKVDDSLEWLPTEGTDLSFKSEKTGLQFDLVSISNDGELLEGKIIDTATGNSTKINCLDISLEN